MNQEPAGRKRTRSEKPYSDELEDPQGKKRRIVEGQNGPTPVDADKEKYAKMMKKLKKKIGRIEDSKAPDDSKAVEDETEIQKPKKEKHKEKKDQTEKEEEYKPKKKKDKHKERDEEIKQEVEEGKSKEKKHKKQKRERQKDEEEEPQGKKKEKKSKSKRHHQSDQSMKEEEEEEKPKEKSKKKKKKKDQSEQQELSEEQEVSPSKGKKGNDDDEQSEKKKRGRKPSGPIKRKRQSIFQRQQIINKKYRVKKKSHYLNKMSERTWGPMRAGPYREVTKPSKQQEEELRKKIFGDEKPAESTQMDRQQNNEKNEKKVKLQTEENEKQEHSQKSKSKKKKKKKQESSDDEGKNKKKKSKSKAKKEQQTKSTSKSKKKKKKVHSDEDDDVKLESNHTKSTKVTRNNQGDTKLEHDSDAEDGRSKKSKKTRKSYDSNDDDSDSEGTSSKKGKKSKKDGTKKEGSSSKKPRAKSAKQEQNDFTKEQSQKIINLFAVDGGNYPEMMKDLPGIRLKKVRMHLRMLFHRCLDIITHRVQTETGRKIKQWEVDQRTQIVRQLHRIRSSNRLLSENNVIIRDKMTDLMHSFNDESYLSRVQTDQIEFLYRRLEAFVRGYNTINRSKRTTAASITESKNKEKESRYKFSKEVTRKPIICGGHLLSRNVKNEFKEEQDLTEADDRSRMAEPEKLVQEWNRAEEIKLCQLYVSNQEADETICDKLKQQFGQSIKWRDFELLGRKIDQCIKFALVKLQNLTARPYSRIERKTMLDRKRQKLALKMKKDMPNADYYKEYYSDKLKATSMFLYDNEIYTKEERLQYKHRIFKNLSLLQRQIFGHIQSYKVKTALVCILIEEFPPEEEVENAVRECKKFSKWARDEEKKHNISSIKNIFAGERQEKDYLKDGKNDADYSNEDSIMADVDKVQIIKRHPDGRELSKAGDLASNYSYDDEQDKDSGIKFGSSLRGDRSQVGTMSIVSTGRVRSEPIELDEQQVEVSDFEQPPSVQEQQNKVDHINLDDQPQNFSMLSKLYSSLNNNQPGRN